MMMVYMAPIKKVLVDARLLDSLLHRSMIAGVSVSIMPLGKNYNRGIWEIKVLLKHQLLLLYIGIHWTNSMLIEDMKTLNKKKKVCARTLT